MGDLSPGALVPVPEERLSPRMILAKYECGLGKQECGRYDSAAGEGTLMLSRGTVRLVDRDAPQYDSFARAFSARG